MKMTKKFLSLLLTLAMAMAMTVTAFADNSAGTSTLTINGTAGHTYHVYQMLTGSASDIENATSSTDGKGTLGNIKAGANLNTTKGTAADFVAAIKDLTKEEIGYTADEWKVATDSDTTFAATTDKTSTTLNVTNGYYLVEDSWTDSASTSETLSRYMVAVSGPTTMNPKATTVTSDKKIVDTDANEAIDTAKHEDTAAIGDVIEYNVTSAVPETEGFKYYYFAMNDTMSTGLTLNDSTEYPITVTIGSKTLTRADTITGTTEEIAAALQNAFYVKKGTDGKFEVIIADLKGMVDAGTINVGDTITISYSATVNENASIGSTPNTNKEQIVFSNDPKYATTSEKPTTPDTPPTPPTNPDEEDEDGNPVTVTGITPEVETDTYVTALEITKTDADNNILTGAGFTITGTNLNQVKVTKGDSYAKDSNGEWYKVIKEGTLTTYMTQASYEALDDKSMYTVVEGKTYSYDSDNKEYIEDAAGDYICVTSKITTGYTKKEPTAKTKEYYEVDANGNAVKYALTTGTTTTMTSTTSTPVTSMVGEDGKLQFTGLNVGTYELEETTTPAGYNTMTNKVLVVSFNETTKTFSATIKDKGADDDTAAAISQNTTGVLPTTIVNNKGTVLPSTGGIGTTIFYVLGTILVLGAGVVLVARRRIAR